MSNVPMYWTDPDCLRAESRVTEDLPGLPPPEGKTEFRRIRLENSLFFPGGGGQAPDRGTVDGRVILEIQKDDLGTRLEVSGDGAFPTESRVTCEVDGDFRWQSRQQHSGQHLISAALASEGLETLSVHLGEDYCGIEVDSDRISDSVVERVLARCDRWICEGRPINSLLLSPEESAGRVLRRPLSGGPEAEGGRTIRIIQIEGIDEVGCGGVHLTNTAAIRLILFDGAEKIRGRTRLKWLIGEQAVIAGRLMAGQGRLIQGILSVQPAQMAGRVAELAAGARAAQTALNAAERVIGGLMARRAVEEQAQGHPQPALGMAPGGGAERLEGALDSLRDNSAGRPVFLAGDPDAEGNAPWVILSEAADSEAFFQDCRETFLPSIQARGGGRPPTMRGRMRMPPQDAVRQFMVFCGEIVSRSQQ